MLILPPSYPHCDAGAGHETLPVTIALLVVQRGNSRSERHIATASASGMMKSLQSVAIGSPDLPETFA